MSNKRLLNFSNSLNLNKLELTHSVDLVDNKEIFKCNHCELKSFSWNYMKNHISVKHLSEGRLNKCDICGKTFTFQQSLQTHKRDVHNAVAVHCKECNYIALNEGNLRYHRKSKHDLNYKKHLCDKCSYKCSTQTALKQHNQRKHSGSLLKCTNDGCDFDTNYQKSLDKHVQRMHVDLNCNFCGYNSPTRSNLNMHKLLKHANLLLEPCDRCRYSPLSKMDMHIHQFKEHVGILICDRCDLQQINLENLKNHMMERHKRLYECQKCHFFDSKKYALQAHKSMVHQNELQRRSKKERGKARSKQIMKKIENKNDKDDSPILLNKVSNNLNCEFVECGVKEKDYDIKNSEESEHFYNDPKTQIGDLEPKQLLLKLKKNLAAELLYLDDNDKNTPEDQESRKIKIEDPIETKSQMNRLIEENNECHAKKDQTNLHNEYMEYDIKKDQTNLHEYMEYVISDKSCDNGSLIHYVCPYDSCTFMTSTLTDLIITEHFAHDHPDADPLIEIKFIPL